MFTLINHSRNLKRDSIGISLLFLIEAGFIWFILDKIKSNFMNRFNYSGSAYRLILCLFKYFEIVNFFYDGPKIVPINLAFLITVFEINLMPCV